MDADELELIARCSAGEDAAFHELHAGHSARVRAYFARCGFAAADADDLTQDTFVRVFKSLHTFDAARGSFRQWLGTITRNVARKRWGRRPQPENFDPELAGEVFAAEDNPGATAQAREEAAAVRDCIEKLPPGIARVVRLRYVESRTTHGVSAAANMPEATVRLWLKQARGMLERCLKGKGIVD